MVNREKLVIAIHSLKVGGMERVASKLANEIVSQGNVEVHFILYGIKREVFYDLNSEIAIHKPNFIFNNNKRATSTVKTLFFLRKKIKELNPNSVLSFGEYWNNLVLLATLGTKMPVYIADRSTPMKNLGKLQNVLRKYLYPKSKGLIVQTENAGKIYKKSFNNINISVIGNPITEISNSQERQRENIILTVGRLIETKHIDRLIKIFSELQEKDWKLIIVGGDAKKQSNKVKLQELINNLRLENNVFLEGSQKDVTSYYLKSKLFAFTSSSEGFPNVVGEAMSAGLPVVSYDCMAGPSEIIKNEEDGFVVPLFDDLRFKQKLKFLIKNEKERVKMGELAKKNIKRFNSEAISKQFLNILLN